MKLNKIAAAVALVAASAGANAGWVDGGTASVNNVVDGELMFTMWNTELETSVSIDTGIRASEFVGLTADSLTFNIDQADLDWVGGAAAGNNIYWNVIGASSINVPGVDYTTFGMYYTAAAGQTATNTKSLPQLTGVNQRFTNYSFKIGSNIDYSDDSVNNSYYLSGGQYAGFGGTFGPFLGGISTAFGVANGTARSDETLNAWSANFSDGLSNGFTATTNMMDTKYWALDLSAGTLSYVPVPAAAWLFGSALLGLAGVARRKKSA